MFPAMFSSIVQSLATTRAIVITSLNYDGKRHRPEIQSYTVFTPFHNVYLIAHVRRRTDPSVRIGLSLSVSPEIYSLADPKPLYLVVTARILESPQPDKPITLSTSLNPFQSLHLCCFKDIHRVSNEASQPRKLIELLTHFRFRKDGLMILDMREYNRFVTVEPDKPLEIRHEVPREKIEAAGLMPGEVYKAEMTDLGLGTWWWMYGTMDEVEDKKFMRWNPRGVEGKRQYQLDNIEELGPPLEDMMWEDSSEWIMGEDPFELTLVIEKGEVEFEVEQYAP